MNEFVHVLKTVKNLVLFETYPAREKEIVGGRAIDLVEAIGKDEVQYFDKIESLKKKLFERVETENFDCVLILGAGDLAEKARPWFIE